MYRIYFILLFSTLVFTGCKKDFLDVAPRDQLSGSTFWRNADDATKAATGVYDSWTSSHNYQVYFADDWSDDAIPSGFWRFFYYYSWGIGNISPMEGNLDTYWTTLYSVVRKTNVFLDNIGKPVMDESLRQRLTAEIKFIRAFEYHLLYNTWGEVPLITKALNVDELKVGRATQGETVQLILDDLNYAIENLPVAAPETGRITKGAALALKARILLYESRWAEAAQAAEEAIDLGAYTLFQTPDGDGYLQQFQTINDNNSEVVLAWQFKAVDRPGDRNGWFNPMLNTLLSPTKALVDSYDSYDKITDLLVPVNPLNEFINRDPRLDYTVAHTGTVLQDGTVLNSESGALSNHSTGYGVRKFLLDEFFNNGNTGEVDVTVVRYAEILLTYAEAKIEANQIDQSVLDAINEVRARAYGVSVNNVAEYPEITTTNQAGLRDIVRKERRVELAFEGLRWFDIRRWKIAHGAGGVMNGPVSGAKLSDGTYKNAGSRALAEKDYLRPIPQKQIDLTGKDILSQNPGY